MCSFVELDLCHFHGCTYWPAIYSNNKYNHEKIVGLEYISTIHKVKFYNTYYHLLIESCLGRESMGFSGFSKNFGGTVLQKWRPIGITPVIKHGSWNSPDKYWVFDCHVWLPEGTLFFSEPHMGFEAARIGKFPRWGDPRYKRHQNDN